MESVEAIKKELLKLEGRAKGLESELESVRADCNALHRTLQIITGAKNGRTVDHPRHMTIDEVLALASRKRNRTNGNGSTRGYIRDAIAKADQRFTVHHIEENLKHAGHELPRTTVYWALWDMTKKNELRKIESQPGRKGVIYEKTG